MIAKHVPTKNAKPRIARLIKYVVAAQGKGIDPRNWKRTADYILESGLSSKGEKVSGIRVTNCHTDDPAAATTLIEATQAANTRSNTDKTYHLVFSFPPGENPSIETLNAIEDSLVASIGYADHQRISAVHVDCEHLHVHVAINKVHPTGYQNITPYYDHTDLMKACDRLEIEHGLQRTNHGLTGEIKHERSKEIELNSDYKFGVHSNDGIYQSDLLTATPGHAGQHYDGMPELPGSDVAPIERGYSELLPSDARSRLLKQGTEHAGGMRREGLGADSSGSEGISTGTRGSGLSSKAAEAEAHGGIDTLSGYVMREIAPAMHEAANWQELHATLAQHGLRIKLRGAGLVIGSDKLWTKASQVDRAFSFKALTDRFGQFEQPGGEILLGKVYEPKPRQPHPLSSEVYEEYQKQRAKNKVVRDYGFERIKYEGAVMESNLKGWHIAQKMLVKVAEPRGLKRRAMLKLLTLNAAGIRERNWKTLQEKRRKVFVETSFPTWAGWLAHQAEGGDTVALDVLRSRVGNDSRNGDTLTGSNGENVVLNQFKPLVAGNGSISYNTSDGGLVIDRKSHVQAFKTTAQSSVMALELAAKRFKGQTLVVEGTDAFQKEIARLARLRGIKVKLTIQAPQRTTTQELEL